MGGNAREGGGGGVPSPPPAASVMEARWGRRVTTESKSGRRGVSWCERDGRESKRAGSAAGVRGSVYVGFFSAPLLFFRGYHDLPVTGMEMNRTRLLCASAR
jgi:hypothetical protein